MIIQKLIGVVVMAVSFAVLYLISAFNPPTLVQILVAFIGSAVCLLGIVVLFSEDRIQIREVLSRTPAAVGHRSGDHKRQYRPVREGVNPEQGLMPDQVT